MAKRPYEGSPQDRAEDRKGAREMGITQRQYEQTDRDRREDRAGRLRQEAPKLHAHRQAKR